MKIAHIISRDIVEETHKYLLVIRSSFRGLVGFWTTCLSMSYFSMLKHPSLIIAIWIILIGMI